MFTNAKLETSCKNECEPAKIATYSVYYTKYPEQKCSARTMATELNDIVPQNTAYLII
jgi:hypothetical protein